MASVCDVFNGVFAIKLCEGEGLKMLVHHHALFLNVDGWLSFAATVGIRKKVPVGWAEIWRQMRIDSTAFMLHSTVTIVAPLGA